MDISTKNLTTPAPKDRRQFLGMTAATITSRLFASDPTVAGGNSVAIKAIAFDAFAIFDPRPVFALTEQLFPGKGAELSNQWRARQFEYTWLRNSMGRYVDFWHVTADALKYTAAQLQLTLSPGQSAQLMAAYLELKPWPDVVPVLQELRQRKVRLALLSNLTATMLQSCVKVSRLDGLFDFQLSTDRVSAFKPDPRAYNMGLDAFGISREEIAFVAFAGWDAAGAKTFGYPTYWANRLALPAEELGVTADMASKDLKKLPGFIETRRSGSKS